MHAFFKTPQTELLVRHKEYIESRLALILLKVAKHFSAVKQLSQAIIKYLENDKNKILKIIHEDLKIKRELYDKKYFGHLRADDQELTDQHIYQDMLFTLKNDWSFLDKIMQIHCVFIYRIYPLLTQNKINSNPIPGNIRGRVEKINYVERYSELFGITKHPVFTKLLSVKSYPHVRAMEGFEPDFVSTIHELRKQNLPFASGLSGHTVTLMTGMLQILSIHNDELIKEYALACFAFLTAGGHHTFHEVMFGVYHAMNLSFEIKNYADYFPQSFKSSRLIQSLCDEFPQYFSTDERILLHFK